MSSAPSPEDIARDATWLAQALDPAAGQVRMIAMSRDSYRAASFLDDRIIQQPVDAQIVPWPVIEEAMSGDLRTDARWIFHIGHVGSTLVSRLLGEIPGILAIREPRLMRDLALAPEEVRARYLAPVPKLMSRTFAPDEFACVKATSFASEVAAELVPPQARVALMYATPANYIASILAGPNSVQELRMLADHRWQRMTDRVEGLSSDNDADLAAVAWACEMTALEAASASFTNVSWLDFDAMLTDMPYELGTLAEFFGFSAGAETITSIAMGPLIQRYSKDLGYEYSAGLRRELIEEATAAHRADINRALAMLGRAAEKSPLLARALDRAGGD